MPLLTNGLLCVFSLGEQLETIDKQRKRATEARDLIQYYLDFNKGESSRLDEFRRSSPEAEAQVRGGVSVHRSGVRIVDGLM
jgi:hypothetical protein